MAFVIGGYIEGHYKCWTERERERERVKIAQLSEMLFFNIALLIINSFLKVALKFIQTAYILNLSVLSINNLTETAGKKHNVSLHFLHIGQSNFQHAPPPYKRHCRV